MFSVIGDHSLISRPKSTEVSSPAGRNHKTATCEFDVRACLGTPIAHDWRKDVSPQTVVECWRRDRHRSIVLVGWMEMLVTSSRKIHRF